MEKRGARRWPFYEDGAGRTGAANGAEHRFTAAEIVQMRKDAVLEARAVRVARRGARLPPAMVLNPSRRARAATSSSSRAAPQGTLLELWQPLQERWARSITVLTRPNATSWVLSIFEPEGGAARRQQLWLTDAPRTLSASRVADAPRAFTVARDWTEERDGAGFVFRCATHAERERWVRALQAALDEALTLEIVAEMEADARALREEQFEVSMRMMDEEEAAARAAESVRRVEEEAQLLEAQLRREEEELARRNALALAVNVAAARGGDPFNAPPPGLGPPEGGEGADEGESEGEGMVGGDKGADAAAARLAARRAGSAARTVELRRGNAALEAHLASPSAHARPVDIVLSEADRLERAAALVQRQRARAAEFDSLFAPSGGRSSPGVEEVPAKAGATARFSPRPHEEHTSYTRDGDSGAVLTSPRATSLSSPRASSSPPRRSARRMRSGCMGVMGADGVFHALDEDVFPDATPAPPAPWARTSVSIESDARAEAASPSPSLRRNAAPLQSADVDVDEDVDAPALRSPYLTAHSSPQRSPLRSPLRPPRRSPNRTPNRTPNRSPHQTPGRSPGRASSSGHSPSTRDEWAERRLGATQIDGLHSGWVSMRDAATGRRFYHDTRSGISHWERPLESFNHDRPRPSSKEATESSRSKSRGATPAAAEQRGHDGDRGVQAAQSAGGALPRHEPRRSPYSRRVNTNDGEEEGEEEPLPLDLWPLAPARTAGPGDASSTPKREDSVAAPEATLSTRTMAGLRGMFERADRDGDGMISVRELIIALRHDDELAALLHLPNRVHQEDETRTAFERVFSQLDEDQVRSISWAQFARHVAAAAGSAAGSVDAGGSSPADETSAPPSPLSPRHTPADPANRAYLRHPDAEARPPPATAPRTTSPLSAPRPLATAPAASPPQRSAARASADGAPPLVRFVASHEAVPEAPRETSRAAPLASVAPHPPLEALPRAAAAGAALATPPLPQSASPVAATHSAAPTATPLKEPAGFTPSAAPAPLAVAAAPIDVATDAPRSASEGHIMPRDTNTATTTTSATSVTSTTMSESAPAGAAAEAEVEAAVDPPPSTAAPLAVPPSVPSSVPSSGPPHATAAELDAAEAEAAPAVVGEEGEGSDDSAALNKQEQATLVSRILERMLNPNAAIAFARWQEKVQVCIPIILVGKLGRKVRSYFISACLCFPPPCFPPPSLPSARASPSQLIQKYSCTMHACRSPSLSLSLVARAIAACPGAAYRCRRAAHWRQAAVEDAESVFDCERERRALVQRCKGAEAPTQLALEPPH